MGYRKASVDGIWEFNPVDIANADKVINSQRFEDVFDDKVYVGDIHTEVKEYPDVEFIVITVNRVYRNKDDLECPIEMVLFTDAPIDQEYEWAQSKITKCQKCKRQFPMSKLCEVNGKLICDDCFNEDLEKLKTTGQSKLSQKMKRKKMSK